MISGRVMRLSAAPGEPRESSSVTTTMPRLSSSSSGFKPPWARGHGQSETTECAQAVDDSVGNHGVHTVNDLRRRHDFGLGEPAECVADQGFLAVPVVVRQPAVASPDGFAKVDDGLGCQVSVEERVRKAREVRWLEAVGRRPPAQAAADVGHGLRTE